MPNVRRTSRRLRTFPAGLRLRGLANRLRSGQYAARRQNAGVETSREAIASAAPTRQCCLCYANPKGAVPSQMSEEDVLRIDAELNRRFFGNGPVRSILSRSNAPDLGDTALPANWGTIGRITSRGDQTERRKRAGTRRAANLRARGSCPHERFTRIGTWSAKNGVDRVRARCADCGKEKIKPAAEVPLSYQKAAGA